MRKIYIFTILVLFSINIYSETHIKVDRTLNKKSDISVNEILSKNLSSIGKVDDIKNVKSLVMVGSVKTDIWRGQQYIGAAQVASEGNKFLLAMIFDSSVYFYEKAGFDGEKFSIGIPNGQRTSLGNFFKSQEMIFKEGIFGGVFSGGWVSLSQNIKDNLKYEGIEKIDSKEFYKIRYSSNANGNLKITLYFDKTNYQHILTKYEFTTISRMENDPTRAIRQREIRHTLVEQFGDFKKVGNLNIPNTYLIDLTINSSDINKQTWIINFNQFYYNESLEVQSFRVS